MIKSFTHIFFVIFLLNVANVFAFQPDDVFIEMKKRTNKNKSKLGKAKVKNGWTPKLETGILLTQSSYKDWRRGGENSLAWTFHTDGSILYKKDNLKWLSDINVTFGQSRISSQSFRKTDDRIEIESTVSKKYNTYITPFFSMFMQSQIAPGYKYSTDKTTGASTREKVTNFRDPAYLFQSIGLGISPFSGSNFRFGLAAKEIIADEFRNYTGTEKWYNIESGVEFVGNLNRKILKRTRIRSDLRLFSSFRQFEKVHMTWESKLSLAFNKLFSANIKVLMIFEPQVSERLQIQEILGIGITYSFW